MSELRQWLSSLGLGRYATAFEAEQFDLESIRYLDDQALETLGVPMGPRLKLLAAVEQLRRERPGPSEDRGPTERQAERRQLTVMFCDLVGSTALSEQLDPEELRELMAAYQRECGDVVERYEGHVAQYLGDGLMVYFGWPRAHEDDASRAVRAGLEVVEAVKSLRSPVALQVRIGIATGPVVVGSTGEGDASVPKAAVGETPNVAARVQGVARANQVVIAESTFLLTGGAFDYEDLGSQPLKGLAEPLNVRRVLGTSKAGGRFEARAIGGLTPLVGREVELAVMKECWAQATEGDGQVVLLCGEPGIGKSRIAQALAAAVHGEDHREMRFQCSPYHVNSTLHPFIEQLSIEHFDKVQELVDPSARLQLALTYGQDHEMSSYSMQSIPLAAMGYLDRALANVDSGIAASLETEHVYSRAYAMTVALLAFVTMRDARRIEDSVDDVLAYCRDNDVAYMLALSSVCKGYALARRGELDAGIAQMREAMELLEDSGPGLFHPHNLTLLAEALIARGDLSEAESLLDEADVLWERWREGLYRAETIRVRGDLDRCLGRADAAEKRYREAIAFARDQEAKLFELRSCVSLARLWVEQGDRDDARELVEPIYGWFADDVEAADLSEGKGLLEGLR